MNLLAIDTSGPVAGCAVMRDGVIAVLIEMNVGLTHSETIMPAVDQALRTSGLGCADIDCFVCVAGPGSFTGVRLGVCAVKGLSHAVGKPCARVNALETLSMNFYGFNGLCCPILDARRGQVYCAAYDMSDGMPVEVIPPDARMLTDFMAMLPDGRKLFFTGDGVPVHGQAVKEAMGERAIIAPVHLNHLRADAACVLAKARPQTWLDPHRLTPIYLRAPQAERERSSGRDHRIPLREERRRAAAQASR